MDIKPSTASASQKKRNYFKATGRDSVAMSTPSFLVRYYDIDDNLCNDGPFKQEEKALLTLRSYLVEGMCAWVVSYYGT